MSRLALYLLVLSALIPNAATASPNKPDIETQVLAAFHSLVQASRDLDAERYFEHFDAEKFIGLNSDGSNWNSLDELRPVITNGFAAIDAVTALEFSNVRVSVLDDHTAILVNEYQQTLELKDGRVINSAGGGAQVWSKRDGDWRLVSVSASNKPPTLEADAGDS